MKKQELIRKLFQGSVIEYYSMGFERTGKNVREFGFFQVRDVDGTTKTLSTRQGNNITSQWCYFDKNLQCFRINEPARLLLSGKTL